MRKNFWGITILLLGIFCVSLYAKDGVGNSSDLIKEADQLWEEKSYRLAAQKYQVILGEKGLSTELIREIRFKWADSAWRTREKTRFKASEKTLAELIDSKEHDRWWAEANESLARLYLEKEIYSNNDKMKQYLENARDFWAGSTDLELARRRFIEISFTLGDVIVQNWGWYYTSEMSRRYANEMPGQKTAPYGLSELYKGILKVAESVDDKAKATYSLGVVYSHQRSNQKEASKTEKYFTEVINTYLKSEWADDAYYYLAQYYERQDDYVKAVETYRELASHFAQGESKWRTYAQERIKEITSPKLKVGLAYTFLPDSEIQFSLNWRNIKETKVTFYKLNLVDELRFKSSNLGINNYPALIKNVVESKRYQSLPVALTWKLKLKNEDKHLRYSENKGLAEWQLGEKDKKEDLDTKKGILPKGAYLLLVTSGKTLAYDLVLVTDLGLVVKTAGSSALLYTFDGKTGVPKEGVQVKYHYRYYNDREGWLWDEVTGVTNDLGIFQARFKGSDIVERNRAYRDLFVCVSDGEAQAFSQANYSSYHGGKGPWWLYAFSDRPAYRPNEEISFKGIFRQYDGTSFMTPNGKLIKAKIYNSQRNQVKEATYTLNEYGSFYDTLTLDDNASLGEYHIELWDEAGSHLARSTLFRLEEYKLPEFQVSIHPKAKQGETKPSAYCLGDEVTIEVDAQYYFGAPVAEAEVEYLVYQNAYHHQYFWPHKYPWYYNQRQSKQYYHGTGSLIDKGKITTDSQGKAVFSFKTQEDSTQDFKYQIEVRVVDQSRREIRATDSIKVTHTSYFAYLEPKQHLYRPSDKAEVKIKTLTANDEPLSTEGKITISRNWWREPIIQKDRKIQNERIAQPAHYEETSLFTKFVKTNDQGDAVFEFHPERDGYYLVSFTGFDSRGNEVKAQSNVFVCSKQSKDIGYRYGGIQIIAERDTYDIGDVAKVMLVADNPDTWVLFTTEAQEIYDHQVVHLEGNVKLLEIPIADTFTPNIFLAAAQGEEYQLKTHALAIVVPPEEKFLNVKVTSDKEIYSPQEEGIFDVEVTDKEGNPVIGELALGLVDASVYYIQSEYAPDIRQYFYGDKRAHSVTTQTSFYRRRYIRFVRDNQDNLITEEEKFRRKDISNLEGVDYGGKGDVLSDAVGLGERGYYSKKEVASAPTGIMRSAESKEKLAKAHQGEEIPDKLSTPEVRQDFRSTVIWQPTIVTDKEGKATVKVKFPDSLTTWRATARAVTKETSVGNATNETKTKKNIIVRLQAPRFFTERDKVTISANVHNYTDQEQKIKVTLTADGLKLLDEESLWITIPAEGEKRVDWESLAEASGTAEITAMAQTQDESDAMKRTYPIIPHGIEKFIAKTLVLKSGEETPVRKEFSLNVPKERIPESTSLRLNFCPSMAATMLDALPYLADYPYSCVEQTINRFLPAVIVAKTMRNLGISDEDAENYINYVLEKRGDPQNHPQRKTEPTLSRLNEITQKGLKRLYDSQHGDGGWGWLKEAKSDRFMSAYVLWGLALAEDAGIKVRGSVISKAISYLQKELVQEEDNPDMLAWMLHALAQAKSRSKYEDKHILKLWQMREELNPYTRALFALSESYRGNSDRAGILARNIVNGIKEDQENGTAHWGEAGIYYRFSEGGVEATAFCIKALSNILPDSEYLEPAVRWLILNRRGARWKNTRDTAIAILGLTDYLKTTDELIPDYEYEVFVNDQSVKKGSVSTDNMFTFERFIELSNEHLKDGDNTIAVTIQGKGVLYFSGYLKYFTTEEDITPAGNEVFVERKYLQADTKKTLLKGYAPQLKALKDMAKLKSGDQIRVEITLEAKNHYEYVVVEDYKPSGFEAVELKSASGYATFLDATCGCEKKNWLYREFRDQKVVFFIPNLKQGKHVITYDLRAEVPGEFHGMPNQTHAMYVPEIRANSAEARFEIMD